MDHLPEHIREQLEAQKDQCIFCKILKGEIESKKVYDDGVLVVLLDINPGAKGHALVMPKEHYPILPLISPSEFDRLFGLMPRFVDALSTAMVCNGVSIFMANGAAAGQQSPHFLVHLIPRERDDGLFEFTRQGVDATAIATLEGQVRKILALMLQKHVGFTPVEGDALLQSDSLVIARSSVEQIAGHLEIRPASGKKLSELSSEESATLFRAASLASTALFENLECEATNIIADTREGFVIHVIPRMSSDGLNLMWNPLSSPPDVGAISSALDKTFFKVQVDAEKGSFDLPALSRPPLEELATKQPAHSSAVLGAEPQEEQAPRPTPGTQVQSRAQTPRDDRARIEAAYERLRRV
jgi:histidine triad (HIT) family protein